LSHWLRSVIVTYNAVVVVEEVLNLLTLTSVKLVDADGFDGGFAGVNSGGASAAWNLADLEAALIGSGADSDSAAAKKKATTAEEFLGSNANLVNLNELIVRPPPSSKSFTSQAVIFMTLMLFISYCNLQGSNFDLSFMLTLAHFSQHVMLYVESQDMN